MVIKLTLMLTTLPLYTNLLLHVWPLLSVPTNTTHHLRTKIYLCCQSVSSCLICCDRQVDVGSQWQGQMSVEQSGSGIVSRYGAQSVLLTVISYKPDTDTLYPCISQVLMGH